MNFQMFKLDLEKVEELEIKMLTSIGLLKKQESSRRTSTYALLTMPKPLTVWIKTNCREFFKSFPQFIVIHIVKDFHVVNEAEVDVFLEFLCFFYDPADVGNLISSSSTFSKSSLHIWKFSVHMLLKPNLKDLEHHLASIGDGSNCMVVS